MYSGGVGVGVYSRGVGVGVYSGGDVCTVGGGLQNDTLSLPLPTPGTMTFTTHRQICRLSANINN